MILKQYLNTKYNTIYFPYQSDGVTESTQQSISSSHNFGGNKKVEVGGGKTHLSDPSVMGYYGLYCKARALVGFDTNDISSALSAESSLTATLRLYHLPSENYVPSSITLELYPLTADFAAGSFTEANPSNGQSNWWNRDANNEWSAPGGWDVDAALSSTVTLTPANEHIEISVTDMLKEALSSDKRYYGYLIKIPDVQESSTADVNFKKEIYTGDFSLPHMLPRIDIQYDDYVQDDRFSFVSGTEGRLYFYNMINGNPTAISYSSATAEIRNENDEVAVSSTTISTGDTSGFYYVDLTIPVSAYKDYRRFRDIWTFDFSGTQLQKKGEINVLGPLDDSFETINSKNIKLSLAKEDSHRDITFTLGIKENKFYFFRSWSKSDKPENYVPSEAYYRVYTIIGHSDKEKYYMSDWDRMSSDKDGLRFNLSKELFPIGKYYIEFKINIFGSTYYYADRKHFFKVDEDFVSDSSW